jgi:hypothetical protein
MNLIHKILKNKYFQLLLSFVILVTIIIFAHDSIAKRYCTFHVTQNYSFTTSEGTSYYRYPFNYEVGSSQKFPKRYSKKHSDGFKYFNTLSDAEQYCFAKKSLF